MFIASQNLEGPKNPLLFQKLSLKKTKEDYINLFNQNKMKHIYDKTIFGEITNIMFPGLIL